MAAPQLPVNFDPGFLRGGGRSCLVKNVSVGVYIDDVFSLIFLSLRLLSVRGVTFKPEHSGGLSRLQAETFTRRSLPVWSVCETPPPTNHK